MSSTGSSSALTRLLARLAQGVVVVLVASSVGFLLIKSLPGDMLSNEELNANISPERFAELRVLYGLDVPWPTQYRNWLVGLLHGDMLDSKIKGVPVLSAITDAIPNTLLLMSLAFVSSIVGGVILGTWQGTRIGSTGERISSGITLTAFSLPDFWLAMVLQFIFVMTLGWFPSGGMSGYEQGLSLAEQIAQRAHYLFLPWLSLTIVDMAVFARYQRAAIRDAAGQQFLRTARAKGVSEKLVIWKHALRVSLLPMITVAGLYFPALFVGAILIEKIFGWPGVGQLLAQAVDKRDYYLVTGIVVVGSAMTALGALLADVAREIADPRLRT